MYKKILVEIDESITSEALAQYGLKFSKIFKASFYLFYLYEKEKKNIKGEETLKKLLLEAEKNMLKAQSIIKEGERFKELEKIIKKEQIDLAFLPLNNIKQISKLPCSVAMVKIINMGKLSPKRILIFLKGKMSYLKEITFFIQNFSKIFHATLYIYYFGKDEKIEKLFTILKEHGLKFESKIFPKFSLKTLTFQALSKRIDLLIMAEKRDKFFEIFTANPITELLKNPPCNLIIFKPLYKE